MKRRGFTLIELLIVIAVLGALTAMMTLSSGGAVGSANAAKITHGLQTLRTAVQMYVAEYSAGSPTVDKFNDLSGDYIDKSTFDTIKTQFIVVASGDSWYAGYKGDMTSETKNKLADHASDNKLIGGADGKPTVKAPAYAKDDDQVFLLVH